AGHPEARLVLGGAGRLRGEHERLAQRLLPAGRYAFVGMLSPDALAQWLGRADVYLSASRSDSTSVTLLEAMAAGAIPVVSDIDGNREWVGEGEGARMFAPGDAAGVACAIEQVFADRAWSERARARNRRVVAERAVWSENMRAIEAL